MDLAELPKAEVHVHLEGRLLREELAAADLIFDPTHWQSWRGNLRGLLCALDVGLTEAEQDGLPPVGPCVGVLRTQTASEAVQLVDELVAIRIRASSRSRSTATRRKPVVPGTRSPRRSAGQAPAGLGRTVRAGESSGPRLAVPKGTTR